jgi:hypothetical protein
VLEWYGAGADHQLPRGSTLGNLAIARSKGSKRSVG